MKPRIVYYTGIVYADTWAKSEAKQFGAAVAAKEPKRANIWRSEMKYCPFFSFAILNKRAIRQ